MKLSNIAEISIGVLISRYKYNSANDSKKISYSLFSQNMLSDSGIFQTYKPDMFISTKDLSASCTKEGDIIFGLRKPNQAVYINEDNTNLLGIIQGHRTKRLGVVSMVSDLVQEEFRHEVKLQKT